MIDVDTIMEDKTLTFDEKLKALDNYLQEIDAAVQAAKRAIQIDLMYCPDCKTYYRKQSYEKTIYKKYPKNRNLYSCKEVFDATTEEYPCYICPKGHNIIDNYE